MTSRALGDDDRGGQMARSNGIGPRRWWKRVKREGRKSPLATVGVVAALLALIGLFPLVGQIKDFLASDEIVIRGTPLPVSQLAKPRMPTQSSQAADNPTVSAEAPEDQLFEKPWAEVIGQLTSPTFVIPRDLDDIPRPPSTAGTGSQEFSEWARSFDGVYAGEVGVSFAVEGETADLSLITNVTIDVVDRREPLVGVWIAPDGAGSEPNRLLVVDLDQDPPTVTLGGMAEEWNFPLSVSSQDLEIFSIVAGTKNCDCGWVARVQWVDSDGDTRETIVDDEGQPFRVTGTGNTSEKVFAPRSSNDPWPR